MKFRGGERISACGNQSRYEVYVVYVVATPLDKKEKLRAQLMCNDGVSSIITIHLYSDINAIYLTNQYCIAGAI